VVPLGFRQFLGNQWSDLYHPARSRRRSALDSTSGTPRHELEETLQYGVVKMNIDTDTQYAFTRPIADHMFKNYDGVLKIDGEVGNKKVYDPRVFLKAAEKGVADRLGAACDDLHSSGKTVFGKV
jgi:fructose-bisphosphate aldolase class II